jgi:ABC-type multidrug transport system ATPase subunit
MGEFVVRILELKNICKTFGDVRILNRVNFRLEKGFVYALKGGNGSGKTILLNLNILRTTEAL